MHRNLWLTLFSVLATAAVSQDSNTKLIDKWYAALTAIDRESFVALISDKAVIKLEDVGIEQTKAEFIESLDEWEDAMKGATIRHQIIEESADKVSTRVCYTFSSNESLNREDFKFEAGLIVESVQTKIADSCAELFK
jgi:hypothetical protein